MEKNKGGKDKGRKIKQKGGTGRRRRKDRTRGEQRKETKGD